MLPRPEIWLRCHRLVHPREDCMHFAETGGMLTGTIGHWK